MDVGLDHRHRRQITAADTSDRVGALWCATTTPGQAMRQLQQLLLEPFQPTSR
jgi:hypothetical protein